MAGVSGAVASDAQAQCAFVWSRIVARSWMDTGFREELLKADSGRVRDIYREMGYELPAHVELKVRPLDDAEPDSTGNLGIEWKLFQGEPVPGNVIRIEAILPPTPKAESLAIAVADYMRMEMACFCCAGC